MQSPALTLEEADKFLDSTTSCTSDGEDILSCNTSKGQSYLVDLLGKAKTFDFKPLRPELKISKVNSLGQFSMKFSMAMNIESLKNTTH